MQEFNSIELFSGAGGLALGLEQSGWKHLALVENNQHACDTLNLNANKNIHNGTHWNLIDKDVQKVDWEQFGDDIQLVAGGPPCQPFSLGGKHRSHKDKRDMFPEAVKVVRHLSPECFIFENVKGLVRESFSTYFNYILLQLSHPLVKRRKNEEWIKHLARLEEIHTSGQLEKISYNVIFRVLNAADFGVPQSRHRVFIVGFRSDLNLKWSFPESTHSMERLIWDMWVAKSYWDEHKISKSKIPNPPKKLLKRIERLKSNYRTSEPDRTRYRTVRDAIFDLPDPKSRSTIINHDFRDGARPYPGHTGSPLDNPSKTIKAGDHGVPGGENMIAFPDNTYRYYTVRESARIQTFPDDYEFSGSWTEAMRQIGNAVPVKLAKIVGSSVLNQLASNKNVQVYQTNSTI